MSREIVVQGYESFRYRQLWKITEWKSGCIYKTKPVGYIKAEHEEMLDKENYVASSMSTHLTKQTQFSIPVLTIDEIRQL
jgi:hypothetical protein